MAQIERGYETPRWLHEEIGIPAGETVKVAPSTFANTSMYRWRLVSLAVAGQVVVAEPPFNTVDGGISRRTVVEVGKSGCSDENLVQTALNGYCSTTLHTRQHLGANDLATDIRFPVPYELPRDQGLRVTVANLLAPPDETTLPEITFLAKCFKRDGQPAILAGRIGSGLEPEQQANMDSADLFNRGRESIWITRLLFKTPNWRDEDNDPYGRGMVHIGYRVNPTFGTQWMPNPTPIPVGCLAPMVRLYDDKDEGPRVRVFPANTYLYPRQRMGFTLQNITSQRQAVHLCLFGELEVK